VAYYFWATVYITNL